MVGLSNNFSNHFDFTMFFTVPLLFLTIYYNICVTATSSNFQVGACFLMKTPRGCKEFIGFMSRKKCCENNGYFVREPNEGQLFLVAFLKQHSIPNCESSCGEDLCLGKQCPVGHYCIMRESDSICSSDCVCSLEQRLSGPVCVSNGRRYRNLCELHLESCWHNIQHTIVPCSITGCDRLNCEKKNKKCVLTLRGRVKCVKPIIVSYSDSTYDPLCGIDNVTYHNRDHLKQASIHNQLEIQVAYKGICRADASCMNVECQESDMSCVNHYKNSSPVCIKCPTSLQQCQDDVYNSIELLCLSTKYETRNTCYKDFLSCQNNMFIEILNSGNCLLNAKWPRQK